MSYHLFICRHAQAQEPNFNLPDFGRELIPNGILEAEQAGNWLQLQATKPDLIVCSSAQRTRTTAAIIAAKLAYPEQKVLAEKALYNASESQLLNFLAKTEKEQKTIVLVGHNPGVSDVVSTLSGKNQGNVPTGSVHYLPFEMADWSELFITTAKNYRAYLGK
ncbi:histidine phosphatase family protein [Adhaeribacter swui]|uniref:Histidine phosphatase family protein n=1 Tax=Adhaeribacter swui TaxID=2086471 RepID=A0A7G7GBN8_9BACT|nr:histidine phosphatase family protein [Adhaeribacter swui]QNF34572.1 histidine phosphatase family protein [Adhaeribacter swui]